jgi:hypothetical protein
MAWRSSLVVLLLLLLLLLLVQDKHRPGRNKARARCKIRGYFSLSSAGQPCCAQTMRFGGSG